MKLKRSGLSLFFFSILFLLGSCGEYEKLEVDKEAKRLADSTYRSHRDSLSKIYDDSCYARRDSLFRVYFDSLKEVEAEKIRELIER